MTARQQRGQGGKCAKEAKRVTIRIISRGKYVSAPQARAEGDQLWLTAEELQAATGWDLKPQGFCLEERCIPIPPGREREFRARDRLNLTALARQAGQPLVHDARHDVWSLGETAEMASARLAALEAPDFTLPDLDGGMHSLSDYRGKKVLLMSWASW
jgi:hypothetical protein